MDYEKKYKEIVGLIKKAYLYAQTDSTKAVLEEIFPELSESEDERIRKWIIGVLSTYEHDRDLRNAAIVWLGKQGEKQQKTSIWKHWKDGIAGNGEGEPIYLIKYGRTYSLSSCLGFECDYIELSELDKLLSEKQGEKKSTDKIEPKFKIGDWVVTSYGKVNQVVSVNKDGDGYTLDDDVYFSGSWCDMYHLWTIQDAENGDVLSYRNGQWIFIYKEKIDNSSFNYHILYSTIHQDLTINDAGFTLLSDAIIPATKEQRDLLFKKMNEAGYEWDAEKKELKKIDARENLSLDGDLMEADCMIVEHKSTLSEEDEEMFDAIIADIQFTQKAHTHDDNQAVYEREIDWLKSLKQRIGG